MKKLWTICGRLVFWISWPALKIRLLMTERARVVIAYKDEILVVRSWIGNSKWTLPGGGVKFGEKHKTAVIRETEEELGIKLSPKCYQKVGEFTYRSTGLQYPYTLFRVKLNSKPELIPKQSEIVALDWLKLNKVTKHNSNSDVLNAKIQLKS